MPLRRLIAVNLLSEVSGLVLPINGVFAFNIIFCLFTLRYELEKKSSLVTLAFSAKSCTRDTDSLHAQGYTRLRLVQEMACLYHECKILPRKHSYPNLIPIISIVCFY